MCSDITDSSNEPLSALIVDAEVSCPLAPLISVITLVIRTAILLHMSYSRVSSVSPRAPEACLRRMEHVIERLVGSSFLPIPIVTRISFLVFPLQNDPGGRQASSFHLGGAT